MKSIRFQFRVCVLVLAAFLAQHDSVSAAAGDEHWSTQFGWPGTTNTVLAMALKDGRVYAGGYPGAIFTNAILQVWDGVQWSTLGQFGGSGVVLYDLAFVGNTLYVAGTFTNVNTVAASGLARWDGSSWSSVGLKGAALALAVEGNNLYVAGVFTNAGSVVMTNVGYWDGSAWHALGSGLGASGNDYARAILVTNDVVYVGGSFTNSGSQAITNLAVWNGSSWSAVGGGANSIVNSLAVKGTDLHVGGLFTQVGSTPANYIARWDGTNWFALGSGVSGSSGVGVNSIALFGNLICVAGGFTSAGGISATNFAVWNGSSWAAAGTGISSTGYRAVATASNVYVGGNFLAAGNGIVNQLASWDGNKWSPVGPAGKIAGLHTSVRGIFSEGTNLYVGGSFLYAGRTNATRIARFDGADWFAFGTGLNDDVTDVAVVGTNVYAAGTFSGGAGGPLALSLARWNGAQWVPLNNTAFSSISTLGVRSNDLFIAGYFGITATNATRHTNETASWFTRWDGTNFWNELAFEEYTLSAFYIDGIGFSGMAIDGTNIYLSGHFIITPCDSNLNNCVSCSNVMRFDGTYGRIMGTGLNSNATSIAVVGTNVYFAGPFTNAGGVTVNRIARWDGQAWFNVGGGVVGSGTINALAAIGTNLYAGGTFTNIGGVPVTRIAKWNGMAWSALGSGTFSTANSGPVLALTAVGQDLYVGGTFRVAGGKPSYYLARWNETRNFDDTSIRFSKWMKNETDPFQSTITASGVPAYVIESSTNLSSWSPLLTNSVTPFDLIDSNSPASPRRFYRAHSLP